MGKQTRYYRRNRRSRPSRRSRHNKQRRPSRRNKRRTRYRRSHHQRGGNLQFQSNEPRSLGYSYVNEPLSPSHLGLANPPPYTAYTRCRQ